MSVDTKKCIITGNDKLIAMLGIEDIIIVDTEDELLICSKDKAQNVKEVLQKLKKEESGVFMIYFLRNISKYFCYLYCFLGKGGTIL